MQTGESQLGQKFPIVIYLPLKTSFFNFGFFGIFISLIEFSSEIETSIRGQLDSRSVLYLLQRVSRILQ